MEYLSIQDLDLSNATIIGFNHCSVSILGSDLVCSDVFGRVAAKFPFDLNCKYKHTRGLPEEIGINEEGNLVVWEIDYDDEDYFADEDQPSHILEGHSYMTTLNFTIVIKHQLF